MRFIEISTGMYHFHILRHCRGNRCNCCIGKWHVAALEHDHNSFIFDHMIQRYL